MSNIFAVYMKPRILAVLLLGFASGLPLALTASTLSYWLTEAGVELSAIGLFAAVGTPYSLKFLWSPLIDSLRFPILCRLLGQRSGWLIATQLILAASLVLMAFADPAINPWWTAAAALLVAIASASQDIVIDAYRVEILEPEEQGAGAAMAVLGYRFGMIASTAGALYLASMIGWQGTYFVMAALLSIGMVTVLVMGEPKRHKNSLALQAQTFAEWFKEAVIDPFADFMRREHWLLILMFILLYKFADAFIGGVSGPFLIGLGFTKVQIASIVKLYGIIATILGSFIGGIMVARIGMLKSLWICGIAHALTNLMFVVQARAGADMHILALSISLENITGGMGTAAFVAYISNLCNLRFTATQYALLSSFAALGRTWLSTPAGWVAEKLGWETFFFLAAALAIPGLILLSILQRTTATSPQAGATSK